MIKSKQTGFTLIELVVVIVILGILAAFAVPRFMGLESEARASTIKSLAGTLRSTAAMARAKCQAQSCGAAGQITIDGQTTRMRMVNGYPTAATIHIGLQDISGFARSTPNGRARFLKIGSGANCYVEYVPAAAGAAPTIAFAPTVTAVEGTAAFNQQLATACE